MKLTSILDPSNVVCSVKGNSREEVYADLLEKTIAKQVNVPEIVKKMIEREDSIMMPYEMGLAIPHTRETSLNDLFVFIGILEHPIKLKENDMGDTRVIIMTLISDTTSDTYLKSLSTFSRFFMGKGNMDEFVKCKSSSEIFNLLDSKGAELKKDITAEDIMISEFDFVSPSDPISKALDIFTRGHKTEIPVVENNKLLGVIEASAIVLKSIPQYILMMDNINFLSSFEPFQKLMKEEASLTVKDYMRQVKLKVKLNTPLIQVTIPIVRDGVLLALVVDNDDTLLGIISMQELINKVLRG